MAVAAQPGMDARFASRLSTQLPLGPDLTPEEAGRTGLHGLAALLPESDAGPLLEALGTSPTDGIATGPLRRVEASVAERLGVTISDARELLRTVCSLLPRFVDASLSGRLKRHLPAELAVLLYEPSLADPSDPDVTLPAGDADEGR